MIGKGLGLGYTELAGGGGYRSEKMNVIERVMKLSCLCVSLLRCPCVRSSLLYAVFTVVAICRGVFVPVSAFVGMATAVHVLAGLWHGDDDRRGRLKDFVIVGGRGRGEGDWRSTSVTISYCHYYGQVFAHLAPICSLEL